MSKHGFISLNNQVYIKVCKLQGGAPDKVHPPHAIGKIRQDSEASPYLIMSAMSTDGK